MKKNWKSTCAALAAVIVLTALDQWTKLLAAAHLKDQAPVPLINGVLELQYLENRGAAFGIMQGQKILFVIFTVILAAVILCFYFRAPAGKRYTPFRILTILVFAGAVGTFIDRCRLDYVVDFIYFKLIDFPIFNVADCYVTVSVILFAILILFYYREEELDFLFHPFRKMKDEA